MNLHEDGFLLAKNILVLSKLGNTLLEGVFIRLTCHLHNHDMCLEYEVRFMHVYDCH